MLILLAATCSASLLFGCFLFTLSQSQTRSAKAIEQGFADFPRPLLSLTLLFFILFSGTLADMLGARQSLVLGALLVAAAIPGMASTATPRRRAIAQFIVIAGSLMSGVAALVALPDAFLGESTVAAINLGFFFIGLGSLLTASYGGRFRQSLDSPRLYGLLSMVCLVPSLLGALAPDSASVRPLAGHDYSWSALAAGVLVFFFASPLEGAVSSWAHRVDAGAVDQARESFFWMGLLGSRALVALMLGRNIVPEGFELWLVFLVTAGISLVFANRTGARSKDKRTALLMGSLVGPLYPTLLGAVFDSSTSSGRGLACGLVMTAGAVGTILIAPLAESASSLPHERRWRTPLGLGLATAAATLALALAP
jgi:hypothetical protein